MPDQKLFESLVPADRLHALIETAVVEDLDERGDITTDALVPANQTASAIFRARAEGVVGGLVLLESVAAHYGQTLEIKQLVEDGATVKPGSDLATISGNLRQILRAERVMLNFITHLSGIATLTAAYVRAVEGTGAKIYDTRKTTPGRRGLEKYAVRCGGGHAHRIGLYDAMLVKDNHIAHIPPESLDQTLAEAVARARRLQPPPSFVEIEVDTLDQLERVLRCDVDIILLDNMSCEQMREAVRMRDASNRDVALEASGGVNLDTVRAIAETGIERIAVGAITHSAVGFDIGLDIDR